MKLALVLFAFSSAALLSGFVYTGYTGDVHPVPSLNNTFTLTSSSSHVGTETGSPTTESHLYKGQSSERFFGINVHLPTYLPFYSDTKDEQKLFVVARRSSVMPSAAIIHFGGTSNCLGQNVCSVATFYHSSLTEATKALLIKSFTQTGYVDLGTGVQASLTIGECQVQCQPTVLMWIDKDRVFAVSARTGGRPDDVVRREFKKAAAGVIQGEARQ